ncbi:hypothetical protein L218DRAFT_1008306 [Marasmius fiardii PR-910]|nr:hypothetical protein L218DRAFT_1008306 [Marasmius fiardii PR-910]
MAVTFEITAAQIVALFMESILYGIYLIEKQYWILLVFALLLGLVATNDVAFGLRHSLDAFAYYKGPGGAVEELQDISYWVSVMKTVDNIAQTFIGDAMLLFRCYIVYERSWKVIIVPVILWIGGTVTGVLLIYTFATLKAPAFISTTNAQPYGDTAIGISLAINVVTTGLIVWRIWSIDKQNTSVMTNDTDMRARSSKLRRVVRILIDSAGLYTIATIIFVITYVTGSNASYPTSDCLVQIIGISFNLIIIRVDAGKSTFTSMSDSAGTSLVPLPLQMPEITPRTASLFFLQQSTIGQSDTQMQADSYAANNVIIKVGVDRESD